VEQLPVAIVMRETHAHVVGVRRADRTRHDPGGARTEELVERDGR
jgi:hypothetical protein